MSVQVFKLSCSMWLGKLLKFSEPQFFIWKIIPTLQSCFNELLQGSSVAYDNSYQSA